MAYCTLDDIKKAISAEDIAQLTDDAQGQTIDELKVAAAIAYADEIINGFLRGRYSVPLETTPELIKHLSVDITVYRLHERKLGLDMPETMNTRYKNSIETLKQIQHGQITLGTQAGDTPEPGKYVTNKTSSDRVFSEEELGKMV